ncbi:ROK family protein [Glycomyces sp. NRRL B-16210]|uniref:ROK family protein n=1 Tax=Glycomyces sp. NRRL B-16210 TaxID=1463821 RepID=UPI0006917EB3|nr:ROK family protein [Glycomyces sp. NRRL B-16210]
MARPGTEELRRRNRAALLEQLHRHGPQTRAELTEALGLNRSTIATIAADLAESGHIQETTGRSTGSAGRPSTLVACVPKAESVAAVEIRADRVRFALYGLGGEVLERAETPLLTGVEASAAAAAAAALVEGAGAEAVAAVPGLVDAGEVAHSTELGWAGSDVAADLADATGREWLVVDTATAAAVGEWTRGDAFEATKLLYLHGGRGVTAGLVVEGRSQRGGSIQLGHIVVEPNGQECACGLRGCLEAEMEAFGYAEDIERATMAAGMGDASAKDGLRRSGQDLGRALGAVVTATGPDEILFGGWLRELYLSAAAPVRSALAETTLPHLRSRLRLRTPVLGQEGPLIGAAETGFAALFDRMR